MRIEQLVYFIEIAKTHSFSLAAENLFVSQPAISSAINKLESELDCSLFTRSKNGIALTAIGQQILTEAQQACQHIDNITQLADKNKLTQYKALKGEFTVQLPPPVSNWLFGKVSEQLKQLFPFCSISCFENDTQIISTSFPQSKYDLNIFTGIEDSKGKLSPLWPEPISSDWKIENIFSCRQYVAVSENSPLASRKSVSVKEIIDLPLGLLKYAPSEENYIQRFCLDSHKLNIIFRTNNYSHLIEQIKKDTCVSFSTSFQPKIDGIVLIPVSDPVKIQYFAAYSESNPMLPVITEFLRILKGSL